ncbi:hypothetical protein CIK05_07890 [Bdellovibrio sp. qaytius]|nr:hypothetical protein CIK05_07890 [Bdellovibrio sp. qaytius]
MKNIVFVLILTTFTSLVHAGQINLCRRWYSYDIFQTYLRLNVDPKASLIIMDRHIPYGIRPMGYKINKAVCDETKTSVKIYSTTELGENFLFSFHAENDSPSQSGYVTYFDQTGDPTYTQEWECFLDQVKELCAEY